MRQWLQKILPDLPPAIDGWQSVDKVVGGFEDELCPDETDGTANTLEVGEGRRTKAALGCGPGYDFLLSRLSIWR
jgi:hypothetical protein